VLRPDGNTVSNAVPVHLLHRVGLQMIQGQATVFHVLGQHTFLHQHAGQASADLLQNCFKIGLGGGVDLLEYLFLVLKSADVDPIQNKL